MGLCKTSNICIFTFITASDLKFCTRSYGSCVYCMMRFKGSNRKVCKMMSHFRTLLQSALIGVILAICYQLFLSEEPPVNN